MDDSLFRFKRQFETTAASEFSDHFPALFRRQRLPNGNIDIVADELRSTVAPQDLNPAGVSAARCRQAGVVTVVSAIKRPGVGSQSVVVECVTEVTVHPFGPANPRP